MVALGSLPQGLLRWDIVFLHWNSVFLLNFSSGQLVAEWHAGPQLQRAFREEDSGESAGERGPKRMEQSAVVVGGTVFNSRGQDRHPSAALQAPTGIMKVKLALHAPEQNKAFVY